MTSHDIYDDFANTYHWPLNTENNYPTLRTPEHQEHQELPMVIHHSIDQSKLYQ
jgi:hypothetical protein